MCHGSATTLRPRDALVIDPDQDTTQKPYDGSVTVADLRRWNPYRTRVSPARSEGLDLPTFWSVVRLQYAVEGLARSGIAIDRCCPRRPRQTESRLILYMVRMSCM